LVIIIAGLLLGGRAAIIFAILSASSVGAVWYAEVNGIVVRHIPAVPGSYELVTYSVMFCLVALLLRYAANSINRALEHAQRNERAEAESNRELQKIRASLEQRVAERTANLERRTAQLHAATEVGRGVTTVLEVDRLIQQVVDLIREQFDLHYVGLFLVDETSQWAILRAGTGEVGRALLARNHRLPINSNSIICQCIVNSQARVSAETGTQGAPRSDAAELPAARSEAALPLRSRGQVIGAISVYSEQPAAFDPDTVAILQTVSDQVAVALDNARLFAQSREALEATRRAYGELSQQAWIGLARARPDLSLRKDEYGISSASDVWQPEMETALQTGRVMPGQDEAAAVAAPIKVRGQVIGVIDARKPEHGKKWTPEEVALLETLVEQLGVAMDSARLHQEAQSHAAREQAINTITTRIRSALTVNTILQRAAEELGRSFGASRASIRLEADRGDKHA
jgi:GAF domain-containing protein